MFLSRGGPSIVLEIDPKGGNREYPRFRIGSISNTLGIGAIEDPRTTKFTVIGGQSAIKQLVMSGLVVVGLSVTLLTLSELFAYDMGFATHPYIKQPNTQQ